MTFDAEPVVPAAPAPVPEPDRASLAGALRELEAAKARVERDARSVAEETKKKLVSQLLPVLDNLDRTIKAAVDSG
ncbi:MAG TPA: nucleotide exchange factor GrpE, partial [Kofleriaceae bacterium]